MTDIVERLRKPDVSYPERSEAAWEAANEIERLRKIETAAIALRDDLILRADIGTHDGDHSVQASNSVWFNLCEALNND